MKRFFLLLILNLLSYSGIITAQNPISPEGIFIADPAGRVWKDGNLYVYGSLDKSAASYCSDEYFMLSTSNLTKWNVHKNVFASAGSNDQVLYNNNVLYAPDCIYKNNQYFLYYCQPDKAAEGVAVSSSPTGPFVNGTPINLHGHNEIDPGIFIDDDGAAYYVWGQFQLKMAKLDASMKKMDATTIIENVITEKNHYFHEGAFMTKRNGIYYLIYAHMGRKDKPSCIAYASSKKATGPYKYGGVIIDNEGCDPANWNNHGSIVAFKNQWYVLYHRTTNGSNSMRKACIEPIYFNKDGSIPEVEMTSQGAGKPLKAFDTIEARMACLLQGNAKVILQPNQQEVMGEILPGDKIAFKYIDFGNGADSISVKAKTAASEGGFNIQLDKPWGPHLGYVHIPASTDSTEWKTVGGRFKKITGIHAVWFSFYGNTKNPPVLSIDDFIFHSSNQ